MIGDCVADNYCLPDFLFDRSPGNRKTNKGSRLLLKFSSPNGLPRQINRSNERYYLWQISWCWSLVYTSWWAVASSRRMYRCSLSNYRFSSSSDSRIRSTCLSRIDMLRSTIELKCIPELASCDDALIADSPFLHFFCIVLVCSQDLSPFLRLRVRDRVLVFESHSDHWPFTYLHDEELPDAASANAKRQ